MPRQTGAQTGAHPPEMAWLSQSWFILQTVASSRAPWVRIPPPPWSFLSTGPRKVSAREVSG